MPKQKSISNKIIRASFILLFILFAFLLAQTSLAQTPPATSPAPAASTATQPLELIFQMPFSSLQKMIIGSNSIGIYIQAVYKFGLAVVVVLAIVMIIFGGIKWIISGGDSGKITQAKDSILKALTGLIIGLFAVFMLQTVSPGTVSFNSITPTGIIGINCCEIAGKYSQLDDAACKAQDGKPVDFNYCTGTQDNVIDIGGTPNVCTIDPSVTCNANTQCGTGGTCGYCGKDDKCKEKKNDGENCAATEAHDDNANGVCKSNQCSGGICAKSTNAGDKCDASIHCDSAKFCQIAKNATTGTCQERRDIGQACNSYEILGGHPEYICKSALCNANFCTANIDSLEPGELCTADIQCKKSCFQQAPAGMTKAVWDLPCTFCDERADNGSNNHNDIGKCQIAKDIMKLGAWCGNRIILNKGSYVDAWCDYKVEPPNIDCPLSGGDNKNCENVP